MTTPKFKTKSDKEYQDEYDKLIAEIDAVPQEWQDDAVKLYQKRLTEAVKIANERLPYLADRHYYVLMREIKIND